MAVEDNAFQASSIQEGEGNVIGISGEILDKAIDEK